MSGPILQNYSTPGVKGNLSNPLSVSGGAQPRGFESEGGNPYQSAGGGATISDQIQFQTNPTLNYALIALRHNGNANTEKSGSPLASGQLAFVESPNTLFNGGSGKKLKNLAKTSTIAYMNFLLSGCEPDLEKIRMMLRSEVKKSDEEWQNGTYTRFYKDRHAKLMEVGKNMFGMGDNLIDQTDFSLEYSRHQRHRKLPELALAEVDEIFTVGKNPIMKNLADEKKIEAYEGTAYLVHIRDILEETDFASYATRYPLQNDFGNYVDTKNVEIKSVLAYQLTEFYYGRNKLNVLVGKSEQEIYDEMKQKEADIGEILMDWIHFSEDYKFLTDPTKLTELKSVFNDVVAVVTALLDDNTYATDPNFRMGLVSRWNTAFGQAIRNLQHVRRYWRKINMVVSHLTRLITELTRDFSGIVNTVFPGVTVTTLNNSPLSTFLSRALSDATDGASPPNTITHPYFGETFLDKAGTQIKPLNELSTGEAISIGLFQVNVWIKGISKVFQQQVNIIKGDPNIDLEDTTVVDFKAQDFVDARKTLGGLVGVDPAGLVPYVLVMREIMMGYINPLRNLDAIGRQEGKMARAPFSLFERVASDFPLHHKRRKNKMSNIEPPVPTSASNRGFVAKIDALDHGRKVGDRDGVDMRDTVTGFGGPEYSFDTNSVDDPELGMYGATTTHTQFDGVGNSENLQILEPPLRNLEYRRVNAFSGGQSQQERQYLMRKNQLRAILNTAKVTGQGNSMKMQVGSSSGGAKWGSLQDSNYNSYVAIASGYGLSSIKAFPLSESPLYDVAAETENLAVDACRGGDDEHRTLFKYLYESDELNGTPVGFLESATSSMYGMAHHNFLHPQEAPAIKTPFSAGNSIGRPAAAMLSRDPDLRHVAVSRWDINTGLQSGRGNFIGAALPASVGCLGSVGSDIFNGGLSARRGGGRRQAPSALELLAADALVVGRQKGDGSVLRTPSIMFRSAPSDLAPAGFAYQRSLVHADAEAESESEAAARLLTGHQQLNLVAPLATQNDALLVQEAARKRGFSTATAIALSLMKSGHLVSTQLETYNETSAGIAAGMVLSILNGSPHGALDVQNRSNACALAEKLETRFVENVGFDLTVAVGRNKAWADMVDTGYGDSPYSNIAGVNLPGLQNPNRANGSLLNGDGGVELNTEGVQTRAEAAEWTNDPSNRGRLIFQNAGSAGTTKVEAHGWMAATAGIPWGFTDVDNMFPLVRLESDPLGDAIDRLSDVGACVINYPTDPISAICSPGTSALLPNEWCGLSGNGRFPTGGRDSVESRRLKNLSGAHLSDILATAMHRRPEVPTVAGVLQTAVPRAIAGMFGFETSSDGNTLRSGGKEENNSFLLHYNSLRKYADQSVAAHPYRPILDTLMQESVNEWKSASRAVAGCDALDHAMQNLGQRLVPVNGLAMSSSSRIIQDENARNCVGLALTLASGSLPCDERGVTRSNAVEEMLGAAEAGARGFEKDFKNEVYPGQPKFTEYVCGLLEGHRRRLVQNDHGPIESDAANSRLLNSQQSRTALLPPAIASNVGTAEKFQVPAKDELGLLVAKGAQVATDGLLFSLAQLDMHEKRLNALVAARSLDTYSRAVGDTNAGLATLSTLRIGPCVNDPSTLVNELLHKEAVGDSSLFAQDYEDLCSVASTTSHASSFSSNHGSFAYESMVSGDRIARNVGYMGEGGPLDFIQSGALDKCASASFSFYVGEGLPYGADSLAIGLEPTFTRLVSTPDGATDVDAKLYMASLEGGLRDAVSHMKFCPATDEGGVLRHATVAAMTCALDAILTGNGILLSSGRSAARSSPMQISQVKEAEKIRRRQISFYDSATSTKDDKLLNKNIDAARENAMRTAVEASRASPDPECSASEFSSFAKGNPGMYYDIGRPTAMHPTTRIVGALARAYCGPCVRLVGTTDVLDMLAEAGVSVAAHDDLLNSYYPGIDSGEEADRRMAASSCAVDGLVSRGETGYNSGTVATAKVAGGPPLPVGFADLFPEDHIRYTQSYRALSYGATEKVKGETPASLSGLRGGAMLHARRSVQAAITDSRLGEMRPISSSAHGIWNANERQIMQSVVSNIANRRKPGVGCAPVVSEPIGATEWSSDSAAVSSLGLLSSTGTDRLTSSSVCEEVATGIYAYNASAHVRTVVPLAVRDSTEALTVAVKRALLTKKLYECVNASSDPAALHRDAVFVSRRAIDPANLPDSGTSGAGERFWSSIAGQTGAQMDGFEAIVFEIDKNAGKIVSDIAICCGGNQTQHQGMLMLENILNEVVVAGTRSNVVSVSAAATEVADYILAHNFDLKNELTKIGSSANTSAADVFLNRTGLAGLLAGAAEQSPHLGARTVAFSARLHNETRGAGTLPVQCLDGMYASRDMPKWGRADDMEVRSAVAEQNFFSALSADKTLVSRWAGPPGSCIVPHSPRPEDLTASALSPCVGEALRTCVPMEPRCNLAEPLVYDKLAKMMFVSSTAPTRSLVNTKPEVHTGDLALQVKSGNTLRALQMSSDHPAGVTEWLGAYTKSFSSAPASARLAARCSRVFSGLAMYATYVPVGVAAQMAISSKQSKFGRAVRRHYGFAMDGSTVAVPPPGYPWRGRSVASEETELAMRLGHATLLGERPFSEQCAIEKQTASLADAVAGMIKSTYLFSDKETGSCRLEGTGTCYLQMAGLYNTSANAIQSMRTQLFGSDVSLEAVNVPFSSEQPNSVMARATLPWLQQSGSMVQGMSLNEKMEIFPKFDSAPPCNREALDGVGLSRYGTRCYDARPLTGTDFIKNSAVAVLHSVSKRDVVGSALTELCDGIFKEGRQMTLNGDMDLLKHDAAGNEMGRAIEDVVHARTTVTNAGVLVGALGPLENMMQQALAPVNGVGLRHASLLPGVIRRNSAKSARIAQSVILSSDPAAFMRIWAPFGIVQGAIDGESSSSGLNDLLLNISVAGRSTTFNIWGNDAEAGSYLWLVLMRVKLDKLKQNRVTYNVSQSRSGSQMIGTVAGSTYLLNGLHQESSEVPHVNTDYPWQYIPVVTSGPGAPLYDEINPSITNFDDRKTAHLMARQLIGPDENFFSEGFDHSNIPFACTRIGRCTTPSQTVSSAACFLGVNDASRYVTLPKLELLVSINPPTIVGSSIYSNEGE